MTDRLEISDHATTLQRLALLKRGGRMTKFKGQVASFAPFCTSIDLGPVRQGIAAGAPVAALATGLLMGPMLWGSTALAANCTSLGVNSISCSGPADPGSDFSQIFIGSGALTVTTSLSFGHDVTTPGANAFTLYQFTSGSGIVTFNHLFGGDITGDETGLEIQTGPDTGGVTVTSTGSITGVNDDGIRIVSAANAPLGLSPPEDRVGVKLNVNDVTGGTGPGAGVNSNGIDIQDTGNTSVLITSSGTVSGHDKGVRVRSGTGVPGAYSGGAVTFRGVNVSSTNGAAIDLEAGWTDPDGVAVTATGHISSTLGDGIRVKTPRGRTTVNVNTVTANQGQGIYATSDTSGATMDIRATGHVSAGTGGVHVINHSLSQPTIVNLTSVYTNTGTAVDIDQMNSGNVQLTATGQITSRFGAGVDVAMPYSSGGNITLNLAGVDARWDGINVAKKNGGNISVTSSGMVTSSSLRGVSVTRTGVGAGNTYLSLAGVSGATGGAFVSHGMTGQVTVLSSGALDGGTGKGLDITTGAAATGVTVNVAGASGQVAGIGVSNSGSGNVSITSTGAVSSSLGQGIVVTSGPLGGDASVTASAGVTSQTGGISLTNQGLGKTMVTAGGTVQATNGIGILAKNAASGTNVSVSATTVQSGSSFGMDVENNGSGYTRVTSSGSVTGAAGSTGLRVNTAATTTSTAINVNNVTGGSGMSATHRGSGDLTITGASGGTIQSTSLDAISAVNLGQGALVVRSSGTVNSARRGIVAANSALGSGSDLKVYAATVSSADIGILAQNFGDGETLVSSSGRVQASSAQDAVKVQTGTSTTTATVNVNDAIGKNGVNVDHRGSGNLSITGASGGTIQGLDGNGILAINRNGGSLSINAQGTVQGTKDAISAEQTAGTQNLSVTVGTATSSENAINVKNAGSGHTKVISTGSLTGGSTPLPGPGPAGFAGVKLDSGAGSSYASIEVKDVSAGVGIYALHAGSGDLTVTGAPTGTIQGNVGEGIRAINNGAGALVINSSGTLNGATRGIHASNTATGPGTDLKIYAADVTGVQDAITADNQGNGDTVVSSTGHLRATGAGDGVDVTTGSTTGSATINVGRVTGQTGIKATHRGTGDLSITGTAGQTIQGTAGDGIAATNDGQGALTITTPGDVTATGRGIAAMNSATGPGTDLKIYAGTVTGGTEALYVRNQGNGQTVVSATGRAQAGSGNNAVDVSTGTSTTSATISVNEVIGRRGISATHQGSGDLSITSTGTVTGQGDSAIWAQNQYGGSLSIDAKANVAGATYGIYAQNAAAGQNLTVDATSVTGGVDGVRVENSGSGSTRVTTTGAVNGGTGYAGMRVVTAGTTSTLNVADVTGGEGIVAAHSGAGALSLRSTGTITARNGAGVVATQITGGSVSADLEHVSASTNGVTVTTVGGGASSLAVSAKTVTATTGTGIDATHSGTGAATVTATNVTAGASGIVARTQSEADLTITSTGRIAAGSDPRARGIYALGYPVAGEISVTAHDVSGGTGIEVGQRGNGDVSVVSTGTVTGADGHGIRVSTARFPKKPAQRGAPGNALAATVPLGPIVPSDAAMTIRAKDVTASASGILATHSGRGDLSITATGQITAGGYGVYAVNESGSDVSVQVNTVQSDTGAAISVANRAGGQTQITATGTVVSKNKTGIGAVGSDGLTVSAVDVRGMGSGIAGFNGGSGAVNVTTTGLVKGETQSGILLANVGGGDLILTAHDVEGAYSGILAFQYGGGSVSITTTGTVSSSSGVGILVQQGDAPVELARPRMGVTTIDSAPSTPNVTLNTGTVTGATTGIALSTTGDVALTVNGKVTGQGGTAIDLQNVAGSSTVTLSDGWGLDGQVLASTTGGSDRFILGGSQSSALDLGLFGNAGAANGILGFDTLTVTDGSDWTLTGEIAPGGLTQTDVTDGEAIFDASRMVLATGGLLTIGSDGIVTSRGASLLGGSLSNAGQINMVDGAADDSFEVTGDFTGAGGGLAIDVDFSNDTADTLEIGGDVGGDTTEITINALSPAEASGDDILVVDVEGSTDADDFTLAAGDEVAIGVLTYGLDLIGSQWFLTSDGVTATGLAYQAAPSALLSGFAGGSTLRQRLGSRAWDVTEENPTWLRIFHTKFSADSEGGASPYAMDSTHWGLQAGVDFAQISTDHGRWVLGGLIEHSDVSSTVTNAADVGSISGKGFGFGLTATYYGANGFYADAVARLGRVHADISSSVNGALMTDHLVRTAALSLEAGYDIALGNGTTLTPQAQLSWGRVDMGSGTDHLGRAVEFGTDTRLEGRFGVTYEFSDLVFDGANTSELYVSGNVLRDFSDPTSVSVDGVTLLGGNDDTQIELGLGGSFAWSDNASIYGEGTYRKATGNGSAEGFNLSVGAAFSW